MHIWILLCSTFGTKCKEIVGPKQTTFYAFESDHYLSQSFETSETKAEYIVKDQWMGNILQWLVRCFVKAVIQTEPYETAVSGDQEQRNSAAASCGAARAGEVGQGEVRDVKEHSHLPASSCRCKKIQQVQGPVK